MASPRFSDCVFLAVDDLRAAGADGALVDAVAALHVLRHPELLHLAVGGREALQRGGADDALDRLAALGAGGELVVAHLLVDLEAALALVAAARDRGVFVDRHAAILRQQLASREASKDQPFPSVASAARCTWRVARTAARSSSPAMTAARISECSLQSSRARRAVLTAKTRLVRSRSTRMMSQRMVLRPASASLSWNSPFRRTRSSTLPERAARLPAVSTSRSSATISGW